ncbi:iron-sulfur cluster-binding domain-containing protein [Leifsonia kafniensis]|uniref:flavin reductase family protein n=1 Tax=Leifsonia kafniensis TaxID=475957 RepID=UPI0031E8F315
MVGFGGPRNNFRLDPAPSYLFVAGGIGITPLLPMMDQASRVGADWSLLYVGRSRRTMGFLNELERFRTHVSVVATDESGRPDLIDLLSQTTGSKIYACGPESLLGAIRAATSEQPAGWVRMERFSSSTLIASARSDFDVELARSGRVVRVSQDTTIVEALRRAGTDILTSCGEGICGTCETSVLSGAIDHRDSLLDDEERRLGTCMFPCVSRSLGDRLVLDL